MKSLGLMEYPKITVYRFDGGRRHVTLELTSGNKRIRIAFGIFFLRTIMNVLYEIVAKQREFACSEWNAYKILSAEIGYKAPEGDQ